MRLKLITPHMFSILIGLFAIAIAILTILKELKEAKEDAAKEEEIDKLNKQLLSKSDSIIQIQGENQVELKKSQDRLNFKQDQLDKKQDLLNQKNEEIIDLQGQALKIQKNTETFVTGGDNIPVILLKQEIGVLSPRMPLYIDIYLINEGEIPINNISVSYSANGRWGGGATDQKNDDNGFSVYNINDPILFTAFPPGYKKKIFRKEIPRKAGTYNFNFSLVWSASYYDMNIFFALDASGYRHYEVKYSRDGKPIEDPKKYIRLEK